MAITFTVKEPEPQEERKIVFTVKEPEPQEEKTYKVVYNGEMPKPMQPQGIKGKVIGVYPGNIRKEE